MSQAPIYFEFPDSAAAAIALDTLTELGYHAHATGQEGKAGVQLYIDHNDLTSALEIAQANGGNLLDTDTTPAETESYSMAYDLDSVPIPAHVVNEDWPESYYTSAGGGTIGSADENGADPDLFDPSGDDYDRFSAGVRL
ncbi:hypothetical protein FE784_13105 [Paenibacillus hemerocallicola]|jgi:hypothetical protein|uniref:DNA/RNA helicase n=1 Tax=Paenibacillus hemerocallicola TaxID=1172614 RepID=A0A5C4T9X7_9BACL|nr:hypothetical protein [Paenibacillus hemerocallicola]TNJ65853.1 hypothetical protein FE784_13105 [Paenibacillus hemerocallicola]